MTSELIRIGKDPDRKVDALVALIAVDPKTGLEGIMSAGDAPDRQLPLVFTAGNPIFGHAVELARQAGRDYRMTVEVRRYECVSREQITP